jgi:MoxR-like ATPase
VTTATRTCAGYHTQPHEVEIGIARWRNDTIKFCRDCDRAYRADHARGNPAVPKAKREVRIPRLTLAGTGTDDELVSDAEAARSHEYIPMPELLKLWAAVVTGAKSAPPANLMFLGPSGSGKTDGARDLAARAGLPFTKVDAASMTDPEAWFGTRELVVQDGNAITEYRPSTFIESIQKPGVTLIDEANRVRDEHRNVLIPVLDGTRQVMNPLTGDNVYRHPQNFIIMSGNVGLHFTGTNAMDPAFVKRSLTVEFTYIDPASERKIVIDASGCDEETAEVLVRFATETRAKAGADDEFLPISTRELIEAGRLVADGLDRDLAVKFTILNAASSEGGATSVRTTLQSIWNGVRVVKVAKADIVSTSQWVCPEHKQAKVVPAGTSSKTGRPYAAFRACPMIGCEHTEDRDRPTTNRAAGSAICPDCGAAQPAGRNAICFSCGAALS